MINLTLRLFNFIDGKLVRQKKVEKEKIPKNKKKKTVFDVIFFVHSDFTYDIKFRLLISSFRRILWPLRICNLLPSSELAKFNKKSSGQLNVNSFYFN